MAIEVITREDLNEFRTLLLSDLNAMFNSKPQQQKQWLKSSEVRKLLNISPGTLQKPWLLKLKDHDDEFETIEKNVIVIG